MGREIKAGISICLSFLLLATLATTTFARGPKNPHAVGPRTSTPVRYMF
jgi:hypothetical protein